MNNYNQQSEELVYLMTERDLRIYANQVIRNKRTQTIKKLISGLQTAFLASFNMSVIIYLIHMTLLKLS